MDVDDASVNVDAVEEDARVGTYVDGTICDWSDSDCCSCAKHSCMYLTGARGASAARIK